MDFHFLPFFDGKDKSCERKNFSTREKSWKKFQDILNQTLRVVFTKSSLGNRKKNSAVVHKNVRLDLDNTLMSAIASGF
jgi:hypothetical protein